MSHRPEYRETIKTVLGADATFSSYTQISAWANAVNAEVMPAWFVATPREQPSRSAHGQSQRVTDLIVGLKRLGGDAIEDALDADAVVIERLVIGALRTRERDCELTVIDIKTDGGAEQRVGTLTLTFRITAWMPDPALS
ncbi:hypothetical protein [Thioclava kandeliae]|uniref:DUF3168 domain-containing protein n=1 Tax=Thioclava kandeliae TaxID=3070818 RepID=A0ABV1SJH5_9RHOB